MGDNGAIGARLGAQFPKPCPFCGLPARVADATDRGGVCLIRCDNDGCGVQPSVFDRSAIVAFEAWNRREDPLAPQQAELWEG